LKAQSPDILHKTEAGAVMLGLSGDGAVREGYRTVLARAKAAYPNAKIDGVLVQAMAKRGREMILGVTRDPDFGPMLMVGLGGIHVEVLKDVAFGPVPLGADDALDLIGQLKGAALLDAVRGEPAADRDALARLMVALSRFAADPACRTIVLAAEGRSFCAGADFSKRLDTGTVQEAARSGAGRHLYKEAIRLFRTKKPIVGAIHGAAVGGGLGLALVPDFRVTCSEARFSANFNRLGFHPGFGLTATLPRLVGPQQAALLFYTGRRISGEDAVRIGLRPARGRGGCVPSSCINPASPKTHISQAL